MKEVFKEKLYVLPIDWETYKTFPSPNDLKGKILIKCGGTM